MDLQRLTRYGVMLSLALLPMHGMAQARSLPEELPPDNAQPLPKEGAEPADPNAKFPSDWLDRYVPIDDGWELDPRLKLLQEKLAQDHSEIPPRAVRRAFVYYDRFPEIAVNRDYVTIIDFDKPSSMKRMYVIDMKSWDVEPYLVTHGKNSGTLYATRFSNVNGSYMSSLGIYVTGYEYQGSNGRSVKLHGMEPSNSNAFARYIVLHGAEYATEEYVQKYGRLGLSLGCPAFDKQYIDHLVPRLKDGSVLLIHHSSNAMH